MPVRKAIPEKDGVYFITFTCCNWLPLFKLCNAYDAVYDWFNYLKQNHHYIIGYVIMPSHVHAIIAFSNTGKSINIIVSNGKRFIAYDLVNRLQQQSSRLILNELTSSLNNTEVKEGKLHNIFETSFDWKELQRGARHLSRYKLYGIKRYKLNGITYVKPQCPCNRTRQAKRHCGEVINWRLQTQ